MRTLPLVFSGPWHFTQLACSVGSTSAAYTVSGTGASATASAAGRPKGGGSAPVRKSSPWVMLPPWCAATPSRPQVSRLARARKPGRTSCTRLSQTASMASAVAMPVQRCCSSSALL